MNSKDENQLRAEAAKAIRRARRLPRGREREYLRSLARALHKPYKAGFVAEVTIIEPATRH
jgi:hypothetical protein